MKKLLLSFGLLTLGLAASAAADVNVAAPFLQNGAGGRSKGMGEAYTGVAEGPFGSFYNPAALGNIDAASLGLQNDSVSGLLSQNVLAGSMPVGPGGLSALFESIDYGSVDVRDDTAQTTGSSINLRDTLLGVGYGMPFEHGLRAGALLGYFSEDLGTSKLSGALVDLGSAWDWSPEGTAAAVLKNLGAKAGGYSLPGSFCLSGAYRLFSRQLLVDADLEIPLAPNTLDFGVGAEYLPWDWFALRAGYKGPVDNSALESLSFGLGFNFWNFSLDLGFEGRGDLGEQGTLSLSYTFAKVKPSAPKPAAEQGKTPDNAKFQGQDRKQAEYHFHAGKEYENYGQYIDAIVEYKAALNILPDYEEAHKALVAARAKAAEQSQEKKSTGKGEDSESLQQTIHKYYEEGLAAYKKHEYSVAIRQLQLVLELTTQHRQATELLEKAKEALGQEIGVQRAQAVRARENGDLAHEVEAYRKMLELDPENKSLKASLAAAEKKVPGAVDGLYKKGVDQYAAGDLRAALKTFENLLLLQPDHVKAKDAVANIKNKLIQTGE
jgi:tetratricopeptide (TPR) repeat protein